MTPAMVNTGAIIITGDTARKKNANQLLSALSALSGDFVVATAGPDLESVLSARGAGTDKISEDHRAVVANLDVGGGTSNIALYEKGSLRGVTCLDIGGRLVKVENDFITYVYPKIEKLSLIHIYGGCATINKQVVVLYIGLNVQCEFCQLVFNAVSYTHLP